MASRSQMRLQQLTGSAVDIKSEVAQYIAPSLAAALTGSDLQDVLGAMAAAIQRIHGEGSKEVFNQDEGVFTPSIFDIDTAGAFTADAGAASSIKTTAGDISIDGAGGIDLDVNGSLVLDIGGSSITAHQNFMPNSDDSQDIGSSLDRFANAHVVTGTFHKINADLADFASAAVADITPTHVVFAGTGGELEGNSGLIWDGSHLIAASAKVSDLNATAGTIVFSDANKDLQDSASFKYDGTTLFVASGAPGISDSLDLAGDMQVAGSGSILGNLTVAGSLLVQGTTTTLDTQNLLVEDPLIVLAKNQTGAAALDQGMIFQRSGDNYGMIWDESADEFAFINASSEDGTTSGNVSFTEYADLQARTGSFHGLEVVTMAVSDLDASRLVLSDTGGELVTNANFTYNADDLMVGGAGAVVLSTLDDSVEADIFKIVNADAQIQISARYGGNALHISDVSDAIALDAGNGFIGFENGNTLELGLDMATANEARFIFNNGSTEAFRVDSANSAIQVSQAIPLQFRDSALSIHSSVDGQLDIDADSEVEISALTIDMNGAVTVDGNLSLDGSANELRFYEGANYVGFEAPALGADQIWVLPDADAGGSDYALVSDGAGNLSWKAPAQESSKKYIIEDGATPANTSLATTVDLSAITLARAVHVLDVYVNGQLMKPDLTAGPPVAFAAYAGNVASTADYKLDMSTNTASEIKFGFALEADDIVTVIMRA